MQQQIRSTDEEVATWVSSNAKVGEFLPITSSTLSLATQSTVEVAGDQVNIELPADVLFAFGESALTPAAAEVVDTAGRNIAETATESGEVTIIGHTDDQGGESVNQPLSEARAEAVAQRLRPILGSSITVKTEGRGSSEPKVPGTTEEARAANRRVEIAFTGRTAGRLVVVDEVPTELPETLGGIGTGTETVQMPATALNPALDVRVVSVRREAGHLVGIIEVSAPTEGATNAMLFGDLYATVGGGRSRAYELWSGTMANITLLTPASRVFPADINAGTADAPQQTVLGTRFAEMLPAPGAPRHYVVVWPDAGPDATTVTVDAPDMFRITDVPIR